MPRIFEYSLLDDLNIAVAESADHLAHSFDVTLCEHCVRFKHGHMQTRQNRTALRPTHTLFDWQTV